jgi:hypothetical protein
VVVRDSHRGEMKRNGRRDHLLGAMRVARCGCGACMWQQSSAGLALSHAIRMPLHASWSAWCVLKYHARQT